MDQDSACKHGLCFGDGQRKVDYILAYTYKKSSSNRTPSKKSHHNNSVHSSRGSRNSHHLPGGGPDLETAESEPRIDYHEDDKRFRREEFEGNLMETGLELEKDEGVRLHMKAMQTKICRHDPVFLTLLFAVYSAWILNNRFHAYGKWRQLLVDHSCGKYF